MTRFDGHTIGHEPATERSRDTGLMHAGAGAGITLIQLSALFPGLLPMLALTGVFIAVVVIPLLAVGIVATVVATPCYAVWRLVTRRRRRQH